MIVPIKFAKCHELAVMPFFAHTGDSGFDLYTVEDTIISANERLTLRTGLRVELPPGYEIQIRPRSGISAKTNLTVLVGTIDSCYRGEMRVIVHNTGTGNFFIAKGERIAQAVVQHVPSIQLIEIQESELTETTRGSEGFGSTGMINYTE